MQSTRSNAIDSPQRDTVRCVVANWFGYGNRLRTDDKRMAADN